MFDQSYDKNLMNNFTIENFVKTTKIDDKELINNIFRSSKYYHHTSVNCNDESTKLNTTTNNVFDISKLNSSKPISLSIIQNSYNSNVNSSLNINKQKPNPFSVEALLA